MTALQLRFDFARPRERWSAQEWLERLVTSGLWSRDEVRTLEIVEHPERGVCHVVGCGRPLHLMRFGKCASCAREVMREYGRRRDARPERKEYQRRRGLQARKRDAV